MKKILCLLAVLFTVVGLCSCDEELPNLNDSDITDNGSSDSGKENEGGSTNEDKNEVLAVPSNLKYNYKTGMLSWDSVNTAESYIVSTNGNEFTSASNSVYLPIIDETTKIKVKAKNSSITTEWSDEITYNVDQNDDFVNLKLFVLDELKTNTELLEIITYNIAQVFTIICKVKIDGEVKLVRLAYGITLSDYTCSVATAINAINSVTDNAYEVFDIVEYDSLKTMVDNSISDPFSSHINNDFTVEYLSSYTTNYMLKNGKARFFLHSITKHQKDDIVRYYGLKTTIDSEIGEGSQTYIENLSTAKISSSYFIISNDVVSRIMYEAENGITAYGNNTTITDDKITRYDEEVFDADANQPLKAPSIRYYSDTGVVSWDAVKYATSYIVSTNDNEFTTTETSVYVPLVNESTVIKVKACNENKESEWSDPINRTMDLSIYNSIKDFVISQLKTDTELLQLVNYQLSTSSFVVVCKVRIDEEIKLVRLAYAVSAQTVNQAISQIDEDTNFAYEIFALVDYDTTKAIDENELSSVFENLKDEYTKVTYIASYTTKYTINSEKARFYTHAVVRVESETKVNYYSLRHTINSEVGEGSASYIENLADAKITAYLYLMDRETVDMFFFGIIEEPLFGTNTKITDDQITLFY